MKNLLQIPRHSVIRCEALLAELLENGLPLNNVSICLDGSARKRFSHDIEKIEVIKINDDNNDSSLKVAIHVNRDGLYDMLPEGLFHQPISKISTESIKESIASHKRLKEEEKNARRFFQPLEQEFMYYGSLVETHEREIANQIMTGHGNSEFNSIWEIPTDLPAVSTKSLARIMPWVYFIKSDIKAITFVLKTILQKEVTVEELLFCEQEIDVQDIILTEMELGTNSTLGIKCMDYSIQWIFNIHNIDNAEMFSFTKDQPYGKLINYFTDVFIPVEIEPKFNYESNTPNQVYDTILGYGFIL